MQITRETVRDFVSMLERVAVLSPVTRDGHMRVFAHNGGGAPFRLSESRAGRAELYVERGYLTSLLEHVELAGPGLDPHGLAIAALKPLAGGAFKYHASVERVLIRFADLAALDTMRYGYLRADVHDIPRNPYRGDAATFYVPLVDLAQLGTRAFSDVTTASVQYSFARITVPTWATTVVVFRPV